MIYVSDGEDVSLVGNCKDRRVYLPDLGYGVPEVSICPLRTEKMREQKVKV